MLSRVFEIQFMNDMQTGLHKVGHVWNTITAQSMWVYFSAV